MMHQQQTTTELWDPYTYHKMLLSPPGIAFSSPEGKTNIFVHPCTGTLRLVSKFRSQAETAIVICILYSTGTVTSRSLLHSCHAVQCKYCMESIPVCMAYASTSFCLPLHIMGVDGPRHLHLAPSLLPHDHLSIHPMHAGRQVFQDALLDGTMAGFFRLMEQFR